MLEYRDIGAVIMTTPNWQHHSRKQPKYKAKPRMVQAAKKRTKMLIKVDVDADIVYNDAKAHTYAQNHCDKLEYELVDYHYPTKYSEREHPFIKL